MDVTDPASSTGGKHGLGEWKESDPEHVGFKETRTDPRNWNSVKGHLYLRFDYAIQKHITVPKAR